MRNFIQSFLLSICLLLMSMSLQTYYNIHKFDASEVKGDIEYLSSNVFKGRLSGTIENKMIAQYIQSRFQKNRLSPYKGSFYQKFQTQYPKKNDKLPHLKVLDKNGKTIIDYKYGTDFKEDMLNFRTNLIRFDKSNSPKFNTDAIQVIKDSNPYIFFVPEENNLTFRSSFMNDSAYNMYIMVTKNTFNSIKEQIEKGNFVECYVPYEVKETELENVIGVLKGINPNKPPVILSAHFDHVGYDLDNNIYNGALDNASGVAFILEMGKYLSSLGTPERDIIFIGFNAEEFGLLGSKAFVEKYGEELKGSKVFNFDMIGSNNSVPLSIMGSKTDSSQTPFIQSVSATCSSEKIYYNFLFEDASDHDSFRKQGIDAITFCDSDMSRIHTPNDKAEYISIKNINRAYQVASKEVIKYAYNGNFILIYYNVILIFSTAGAMFIILSSTFRKNKI
jgi:Zn-dependent M28 family amino/carboxypeptidase